MQSEPFLACSQILKKELAQMGPDENSNESSVGSISSERAMCDGGGTSTPSIPFARDKSTTDTPNNCLLNKDQNIVRNSLGSDVSMPNSAVPKAKQTAGTYENPLHCYVFEENDQSQIYFEEHQVVDTKQNWLLGKVG